MKKLVAALCLFLMVTALTLPADAVKTAQAEGFSTIPEEILAQLPLKKGDEVVRVYSIPRFYMNLFAHYDSIEAIMNYATISYCVKSADGTYAAYRLGDGECTPVKSNWRQNVMDVYLAGNVIKYIDPGIAVENSYYLSGYYTDGDAIYYQTDRGDYIYYYDMTYGKEYLFCAEAFCAYQRAIYNHDVATNPYYISLGGPMRFFWDLSAYDFTSEAFDPHAAFPQRNETAAYRIRGRSMGCTALSICLAAAVILSALLLLGKKRPQLLRAKAWQSLLLFLVISGTLLLADQLLCGGVLMRDLTSSFLSDGMTQTQVTHLVGPQETIDCQRFSRMLEYDLPFDQHFYVVLNEDSIVSAIYEDERTYPLRGWLLPALLAEIALLQAAIFWALRICAKRSFNGAHSRLALRLLLIFLCVALVLSVLGNHVLPTYFPECFVYEGMQRAQLYATMGSLGNLVLGTTTREFDLLLGRTLTVELEDFYPESRVISCEISGFGDSSCLRFVLPLTIAATAIIELAVYMILRRRGRQQDA